jgi:phage/plasmid-like protein (TIGR03299 family)
MPANVETMAYARSGGVPWHGLGRALDGVTDSDTMIHASGLDWSVELARITAAGFGETGSADVPDFRAVRRSDTGAVLGIVGDGYTPLQNVDAFSWLDSLLADGRLEYETAGSLRDGRQVWALARIPGDVTIAGDAHRGYMLVTTGHDGAHAVNIRPTLVRVVCQNTLSAALAGGRSALTFRIVHTRSLGERMAQAAQALTMVTEAQARMAEWLERAAVTRVEASDLEAVEVALFGPRDDRGPRVKGNAERFRRVVGVEVMRGGQNAYSLLQGVTGYADHCRVRDFTKRDGAERRFETSVISGQGVELKADAFALLDRLVPAA